MLMISQMIQALFCENVVLYEGVFDLSVCEGDVWDTAGTQPGSLTHVWGHSGSRRHAHEELNRCPVYAPPFCPTGVTLSTVN